MAVFERRTWVDAPIDVVWAFYSSVDGLVAVSPDWLHLRVERVADREGRIDDELTAGTEIRMSVRLFGAGPRSAWTTRIVEREFDGRSACFRDRMVSGPLPLWVHTHRFTAEDGGTEVVDRIEYELPGRLPGTAAVVRPALAAVFAHRHRRTRDTLER